MRVGGVSGIQSFRVKDPYCCKAEVDLWELGCKVLPLVLTASEDVRAQPCGGPNNVRLHRAGRERNTKPGVGIAIVVFIDLYDSSKSS